LGYEETSENEDKPTTSTKKKVLMKCDQKEGLIAQTALHLTRMTNQAPRKAIKGEKFLYFKKGLL